MLDSSPAARVESLVEQVARRALSAESDTDVTLSSGASGVAVFLGQLYVESGDSRHLDRANRLLNHALRVVQRREAGESLAFGAAGIAWSVDYVERLLPPAERTDRTSDLEELLARRLDERWEGPLGVLEGLSGVAVYLLDRLPGALARAGLEKLFNHLFEASEIRGNDWSTWWTARHQMTRLSRGHQHGHFDLTVASGVPGIAAILVKAMRARVCDVIIGRLFGRCLEWLQANQMAVPGGPILPPFVGPAVPLEPRTIGWSESSAAVLAVLLPGASASGRADFLADAFRWAIAEADGLRTDAVANAHPPIGLMRGSAGLAHVYNRIFQRTGDRRFRELSATWLLLTADAVERQLREERLRDGFGLFDGVCGAALSLLAGISAREPSWDRVLLLS